MFRAEAGQGVSGREQRKEGKGEPALRRTVSVVRDVYARSLSSLHYTTYEGLRYPVAVAVDCDTIYSCLIDKTLSANGEQVIGQQRKWIVSVQRHGV